jgi:hypothetical protein
MYVKLLCFMAFVTIVYIISTMINVVHINSLPKEQREELNLRSQFRSDYLNNNLKIKDDNTKNSGKNSGNNEFNFEENVHIKNTDLYSSSQLDSRDYKIDYFDLDGPQPMSLPNANDLFILIRSEYIDTTYSNDKYKFNLANLPMTPRVPSPATAKIDRIYTNLIKNDILLWNNLFPRYYHTDKQMIYVKDIIMTYISETESEFVIKADIKLLYRNRTMHFRVEYHGEMSRALDFINGEKDTYTLKLLSIRPMTKDEYTSDFNTEQKEIKHFPTMKEQLMYVDKINKQHKEMS